MNPIRMKEQSMDEFHIRHLTLDEFRKHNNANDTTNPINAVHPGVLHSRTRQCWFKKFKNADLNLFDGIKSERPAESDKDKKKDKEGIEKVCQ